MEGSTEGRPGRVRATLLRLASQRTRNLAFFDQVLASGSNFLTGILLARTFGIVEYGRFTLAWLFVEFIGSLQTAAIIQPMLNIGPKQSEADHDLYYDAVLAQQALACMVFGPVALVIVMLAGWLLSDPEFGRLALPLCAAIIAYQLQCFFRRYFFARDRPVAGIVNDGLRFTVQIAATAALAVAWPGSTAPVGLWIMAAGCAVSAIQGVIYFGRPRWNSAVFVGVSVRHWEFSKWLLPSALMYWMTSQGFLLMSGFVLGAAATGGLKAAFTIIGVVYILLLALDNFAPVQASRALHVGGPIELRYSIARLALLTGTGDDQYRPWIPRSPALRRSFRRRRATAALAMCSRHPLYGQHRSDHLGGGYRTDANYLFLLCCSHRLYRHCGLSLDLLCRTGRCGGRLRAG
jgi:O-antigen/teichoic acid export membrane protein